MQTHACKSQYLSVKSRRGFIFYHDLLPQVHLEGRVLHSSTGAGPRFLTQDSYRREEDGNGMGDLAVCGVEEFVLDHYRAHGFPSGKRYSNNALDLVSLEESAAQTYMSVM